MKTKLIARAAGVSQRTVQCICQKWIIGGIVETKKPGGRKSMFTLRLYQHFSFLITRKRRNTRAIVFAEFRQKFGQVSNSTLFRHSGSLLFLRSRAESGKCSRRNIERATYGLDPDETVASSGPLEQSHLL